jgi:hypothetical protein
MKNKRAVSVWKIRIRSPKIRKKYPDDEFMMEHEKKIIEKWHEKNIVEEIDKLVR